jgi:UPF0755 protein
MLGADGGRRVPRWLAAVGIVAAVAVLGLGGGAWWVKAQLDPSGGPAEVVRVEIPPGTSTSGIVDILAERGVITNATVFRLYLKLTGAGPFEAGQYRLRRHSSASAVVDALDVGPALPPAVYLTVPEGLVLEQVAERIDRVDHLDPARFLELARGGSVRSAYQPAGQSSLEGLLFPETYRIEEREDELAVLQRMVDTFDAVAQEVGLDQAEQKVGLSPYEAVIVASLIETEAKVDEERPRIARVIYNRLAQRMPLGIDATFYFVLPLDRRGTALRRSDLDRDTPYNTRLHTGLVPTPIAMPGRASLEAALNPEPGPWLYYVLKDPRTHAFSSDYQQFLRDKAAAERKGLL